MKPQLFKLVVYFTLFYILTVAAWALNKPERSGLQNFISELGSSFNISSFISFMCASIIAYLTFLYFYQAKGIAPVILFYLCISLPLIIGLRYLVQEVMFYQFTGEHNYGEHMFTIRRYFLDNIYFSIYYSFVGIVYFFIQNALYSQSQERELKLQIRTAELLFLKSQINPHFLFNNLNNLYTLVYQNSPKSLQMISKLSELLRYMLYEKEDGISLQKETTYLQNFIDLQLMRYDFSPFISVAIQKDIPGPAKIIPMMLIPFVENAFKHGDLKDADHPLEIRMSVENDALNFMVINKKNTHQKDKTGGIGLQNVKKRLDLLYKNKHLLKIEDQKTSFSIRLTIILND